jgi:hypothetical protein
MNKLITKTATDTKLALVYRIAVIAPGPNNSVSTNTQIESAAHTAVCASGFHFPGRIFHFFGYEGCYRTALNTFPARNTDRFLERLVTKRADLELITPICHINGINTHDFAAGSNAYATLDALAGIKIKEGIARINREVFGHTVQTIEPMLVKADAVDQVLEAARSALPAQETVEVMVAQDKFKGHTANLLNFCIIRNYHHPCLNRCATGWMKLLLFFNLNQAYTAGALRGEPGTVA